ncbi:hypothetical protein U0R10_06010 [Aquirufa sp. OSTEICH-129V]|jgi:hypothetical protein|uniref:Uncharacterized protein n=1 Tax=Aquirufa avitistagni TaxID=3104728 RepID=A0ABW6DB86_9BACT
MIFRLYPTLLNSFSLYLNQTRDAHGKIIVDEIEMIERINRVKKPTTKAQQKGVDFERAVTLGENEDLFAEGIIDKARNLIPDKYKTQFYVESRYKNTQIYGYVDGVGEHVAFDLKSTSFYEPGRFLKNHQNLYLLGLQKFGIEQLDYVITDFTDVYVESYHLNTMDFNPLYEQIEKFTAFLEENKRFIRDKKIVDRKANDNQLSLFE